MPHGAEGGDAGGDLAEMPRHVEDARELVAIRTARRFTQFPQMEIGSLDTSHFDGDPRDAALAAAVDHAIAKRWLTLQALLAPRASRGWDRVEGRLRGVLMVGAAQLLFLDRIPEHAAIHASVEMAKRLVRPGAAGLVNAILRGVSRDRVERVDTYEPDRRDLIPLADGGAWRFAEAVLPPDPVERLSIATSVGAPIIARWAAAYGTAEATRLALHAIGEPPVTIAGADPAPPGPDEPNPLLRPHDVPGFHVLDGPREAIGAVLDANPGSRVQDPVSGRPVAATTDLRPRRILDACAGRGTKTRQLRTLHPDAEIVAAERDPGRLEILRRAMSGDRGTRVVRWDALGAESEPFDLIVLDVPCSNTGVLSRRVEARYRGDEETLDELVDVQRQIVADTLRLLAPGGHVLYITCSLEPDENIRQVDWIAHWHRMDVVEQAVSMPAGGPGSPAHAHTDGGGHALLRGPLD